MSLFHATLHEHAEQASLCGGFFSCNGANSGQQCGSMLHIQLAQGPDTREGLQERLSHGVTAHE